MLIYLQRGTNDSDIRNDTQRQDDEDEVVGVIGS